MNGRALSRRDLLFGRFRNGMRRALPPKPHTPRPDEPTTAVIQGRHCLAYRGLMCSTCYERCPEPNAIVTEKGIPRVNADLCTGCRVCHDVCPAPTNAVLLITGRRAPKPKEGVR